MHSLRGKCDFQHGSDERGGNSMAGDVRDKDAKPLFVNGKKIVKISGDGAHRRVTSGDVQPDADGHTLRKNGGLNPTGNFELLVDGEETLLVRENTIQGNVRETTNEDKKTDEFHVGAGKNLQVQKIHVNDEQGPNEKARNKNAGFAVRTGI